MQTGNLTAHFTWYEALQSETAERNGIANIPPSKEINDAILNTAVHMEAVRDLLGPISPSSWFRCIPLNRLLKSKDTSQHTVGEAVDFIPVALKASKNLRADLKAVWQKIKDSNIPYDQLILEGTWIHISFSTKHPPRKQAFILNPITGAISYG